MKMKMKSILKENGMDRAQLILAAKAVTDDLQDMAEKVAKMEAEGIMPLLDGIRMSFGPEFAERLSDDATAALRSTLEAIKASKDQIGANVQNMEQILTGEGPGSDMATGTGLPPEATVTPDEVAEPVDATQEEDDSGDSEDDLADVFGDDAPAGRETKEGALSRNVNMLRESENPDRIIMTHLMARLKRGDNTQKAVNETARSFGIDADDVTSIVRDFTKKEKVTESVNADDIFADLDWNEYDGDWPLAKSSGYEITTRLQAEGLLVNIDDVIKLQNYCEARRVNDRSYLGAVMASKLADIRDKLNNQGYGLPRDRD